MMPLKLITNLALTAGLLLGTIPAPAQVSVQAATDRTTYNVGSVVRLELLFPNSTAGLPGSNFSATLRYAGESKPLLDHLALPASSVPSGTEHSTGYHDFWKTPLDAQTGRYEIDLEARDVQSQQIIVTLPRAASFALHRKLVRIERLELDKTFYTSGDPVGADVTLQNLTERPLTGLRVEFSDRYWPWTAQSSERAGVDVTTLDDALAAPAAGRARASSSHAAVAKPVKRPTSHQYAVVIWDRERKDILDIAFSPLIFIHPPGVDSPKPYPLQYLYPDLEAVNFSSYRDFYPAAYNSSAIQFDRTHTMFASGSEAVVKFTVLDPSPKPWHGVSIRARWLGPNNTELQNSLVAERIDLEPRNAPIGKGTKFILPAQAGGIYRAEVEVSDASGQVLAMNALELGVNPLPKSILIFCAHEDDEGAHAGIIRAAVENRIPIHLVYFTSGDAGSCDRYYQHSCGPTEALNFGALRMEEARAALGHLGVPRQNIFFLGLPDGGSGQIWFNHIQPSRPYLSVLLASDHAPYEGLARPNLPYARASAVDTAKEFIKRFRPEVIYTGHPDERHVDHRTNNWFVVKALQELVREGAISWDIALLVDQVYGPGPQAHAPYNYRKHVLNVSGETAALAQEAEWFYQSQGGNKAEGRIRTFDRLPHTEGHWQILDWKEHEGWNERE